MARIIQKNKSDENPDQGGSENVQVEEMLADVLGEVPGGGDSGQADEDGEDLAVQLAQAADAIKERDDKFLRFAAEFENYKKRMARDKETALKFAEEGLLKEMLPFIDNLERAIDQGKNANDMTSLLAGVELTLKGLVSSLEKIGLQKVASAGAAFDPNIHEAMAMEASEDVPAQAVIREFEKGYLFRDKLIRAAKVVVSSGPGSES